MLNRLNASFENSPTIQYMVGVLIFLVALTVRFSLLPINAGLPFVTFYPSTILCFYLCGCRAGVLHVALSAVWAYFIFIEPNWSFVLKSEALIPVTAYLLTAMLMGYIVNISKRSKARYKALLEDQSDFISRLKADGTIIYVNQAYADYFGIPKKNLIGSSWTPVAYPEDIPMIQSKLSELKPQNPVVLIENRIILSNQQVRWAQFINRGFFDEWGKLVEIQSVGRDLTSIHELQNQLIRFNKEQELMLNNELVGILKLKNSTIVWANKAMELMSGYSHEELIGQEVRMFYPTQISYEAFGESLYQELRNYGKCRTQLEWVMKNNATCWVDLSGATLNPKQNESLWLILDISEIKKEQFRVEYIAHHDMLTGLSNRMSLEDNLNYLIEQTKKNSKLVVVCYLDLDNFKPINDHHGHAAGDVVLIEVSRRIQQSIRSFDMVSRLGGDEFIILINGLVDSKDYLPVLNRVITEIKKPIKLPNGESVQVGASVGVSCIPRDSEDTETIIKLADQAMYQAKANGRNQIYEHGN